MSLEIKKLSVIALKMNELSSYAERVVSIGASTLRSGRLLFTSSASISTICLWQWLQIFPFFFAVGSAGAKPITIVVALPRVTPILAVFIVVYCSDKQIVLLGLIPGIQEWFGFLHHVLLNLCMRLYFMIMIVIRWSGHFLGYYT